MILPKNIRIVNPWKGAYMNNHLIHIVDDAEKYMLQIENDFKWGRMTYCGAVGAVVGIIRFAKTVVCDISYDAYVAPSIAFSLLDRLDEMQIATNGRLFEMEYSD